MFAVISAATLVALVLAQDPRTSVHGVCSVPRVYSSKQNHEFANSWESEMQ